MPTPFESRKYSSVASPGAPVASPIARGPGPAVARRCLPSLSRPGATGKSVQAPSRRDSSGASPLRAISSPRGSRRVGGDLEAGDADRAVWVLGGGSTGDAHEYHQVVQAGQHAAPAEVSRVDRRSVGGDPPSAQGCDRGGRRHEATEGPRWRTPQGRPRTARAPSSKPSLLVPAVNVPAPLSRSERSLP